MESSLKLTSPMMNGSAVKRLQEIGDLLGYDYGPNDGIFGKDTERVVKDIQAEFGLVVDGICGPVTWAALLYHLDVGHTPRADVGLIDIRGTHAAPKLYGHSRTWKEINGITIHQTGCRMPESSDGWRTLNAHVGITTGGVIILVNDFADMIWHAQGLSHATIGVEISGNFMGVEGDERTLWKGGGGPATFSEAQMNALTKLLSFLGDEFSNHGHVGDIIMIHAHRQSSSARVADPGSAIWSWLLTKMGELSDGGPEWCVGNGKPIPKEWNPNYVHSYF